MKKKTDLPIDNASQGRVMEKTPRVVHKIPRRGTNKHNMWQTRHYFGTHLTFNRYTGSFITYIQQQCTIWQYYDWYRRAD